MAATILELKAVERHYLQGQRKLTILNGADFSLRRGEMVAMVAPSGTGKSTLLHTAGLLERPDAGDVILGGRACGLQAAWVNRTNAPFDTIDAPPPLVVAALGDIAKMLAR